MRKVSHFWHNAPIEEIIDALALLPKMYEHPAFPFDKKDLFEMVALQIQTLWEKTEEARK